MGKSDVIFPIAIAIWAVLAGTGYGWIVGVLLFVLVFLMRRKIKLPDFILDVRTWIVIGIALLAFICRIRSMLGFLDLIPIAFLLVPLKPRIPSITIVAAGGLLGVILGKVGILGTHLPFSILVCCCLALYLLAIDWHKEELAPALASLLAGFALLTVSSLLAPRDMVATVVGFWVAGLLMLGTRRPYATIVAVYVAAVAGCFAVAWINHSFERTLEFSVKANLIPNSDFEEWEEEMALKGWNMKFEGRARIFGVDSPWNRGIGLEALSDGGFIRLESEAVKIFPEQTVLFGAYAAGDGEISVGLELLGARKQLLSVIYPSTRRVVPGSSWKIIWGVAGVGTSYPFPPDTRWIRLRISAPYRKDTVIFVDRAVIAKVAPTSLTPIKARFIMSKGRIGKLLSEALSGAGVLGGILLGIAILLSCIFGRVELVVPFIAFTVAFLLSPSVGPLVGSFALSVRRLLE